MLAWLFSIISAIFMVFLLNAGSRACVNHDVSPTLHPYKHNFKFNETKFRKIKRGSQIFGARRKSPAVTSNQGESVSYSSH
ncbi:hypothetical protein SARI_01007 [Salmonella enterica subsp. arizonae serovar 62:z4,z23:-]|uniref:Uncharacterized protein n=1 Tax=Salmonella arizonae (strain ATCC BAA-731 / CDC346-86 / RSK2980) TaxID=41514 RepID=A9MMP5_SALAR|nr:hypothetical protein SARI_01007 [Salmonella enterica subsp. arizonae serovar 62:z4,z23:-]